MERYQLNIFDLMVKKEQRLAELYTIFSESFKEFEPFWEKMAKDEKSHASWLLKLKEAEEKNLLVFDEGKIKTYTMETFLKHLDGLIVGAKKGKISAKKAFSVALDLERSLIETKTFQHFECIINMTSG